MSREMPHRFLLIPVAAWLLLITPGLATEPGDEGVQECSAGAATSDASGRPTIQPSAPGESRVSGKGLPVPQRLPGTLFPGSGPGVSSRPDTNGRWVPGYRPATPSAARAYQEWKERIRSTEALSEAPRTTASNYAENLIRGTRVEHVPEEAITYSVREETYEASTIHVDDLLAARGAAPAEAKTGGPKSDIHHGSGMTWNQYITAKEIARMSPETLDAQDSSSAATNRAPTPEAVSFDAIVSDFSAVPPDAIMAAGPSHLIAIVNRRYQVYDKTGGALTSTIELDTFFAGVANCNGTFDVYVDYDEENDRFVMGGEAVDSTVGVASYLCLAASATNDPTGAWHRYAVRADTGASEDTWIDFPHMGIGLDAVYIAGNMFTDAGTTLDHVQVYALDKADLYSGAPLTVADADLGGIFFTAQPAKIHGFTSGGWPAPGTPHHFVAHDGGGNTRIWRWVNPFSSAPVIYGTIAEASFGGLPPNAPELGGSGTSLNDTGSAKWLDAEYRDGKLWTVRNVGCNIGAGNAESCIDWIQVDVSGPAPVLEQQQSGGAYGGADEFRYYPDVAVDRNNNIAIGYTKSSDTTYTEVWVTGREFGDPIDTLQAETLQRAGLGTYSDGSGCGNTCDRWGDYTGLTVDPDGCTFWYLGQYSDGGNANWGTHIGSFRFGSCSVDSTLQVDKGSVTCSDTLTVTVTDSTPIDASTVSAQTTITTTGGDSETIPPGSWVGSDCAGPDCGSWTVTVAVNDNTVSILDGSLNVDDDETITANYADPHMGHDSQSRNVAVTCAIRLDDGGYLTAGGCEAGTGGELYREYFDGGEYISYAFGVFNPLTAPALNDVAATLTISGPAAGKVTVFNPTTYIGALAPGQLVAPVFQIYIDPSIDVAGLRMTEHDFNLSLTSVSDGYSVPQVVTQKHLLQADDNIVRQAECFNFEAGDQGFVSEPLFDSYTCMFSDGCATTQFVGTVAAPWTRGAGCGSETRDDYPEMSCDTMGSAAFMSNGDPGVCNGFTQSLTELTDDVLFSPIFGPAQTGNAPNGQPWFFDWQYAEWFYRSDMIAVGGDTAMVTGLFWDDNYLGVADPATNETNSLYSYFTGFFAYDNQDWDSATAWDPNTGAANFDSVSFGGADGLADPGVQWRWATEVYDADFGTDPEATPATAGLAIDNMNFVYDQYHTDEQLGSCTTPQPVAAFDQFIYLACPGGMLDLSVLDPNAAGQVRLSVESAASGDSETILISGTAPYFASSLTYATGDGALANDGTLWVQTDDTLTLVYDYGSGVFSTTAFVNCTGGDVVTDGIAALSDNGDGDTFADTNETVDFSLRIRNNTGQDLNNVTAVIASEDANVDCVLKDTASFGTIVASGGVGVNDLVLDPFTFKVATQAECADPLVPPTATFKVLISADGLDGTRTPQQVTLYLDLDDLPGTITFIEGFATDPAGFHHEVGPGDDDGIAFDPGGLTCSPFVDEFFWDGSAGNPGGGYFVWQDPADSFPNGTYSDLNDSTLVSPVFKIGANSTTLSFDHEYQFGWTTGFRLDGARVDYRVNGGNWQKMSSLPYDGPLIWNSYCNPLCNGTEFGLPCFTETSGDGENIFNQFDQGTVNWTNVAGMLAGLTSGDLVQFRWRVGSMNTSVYAISTQGGYGLDNIRVTNVVDLTCDTNVNPDTGCGVVFDNSGNLVEVCGDGDLLIEPTETWSVDVTLRNSATSDAVGTTADLELGIASPVNATILSGPGNFGTIGSLGGTGTASYDFAVDSGAICIRDLVFDVANIADNSSSYADRPAAVAVQVGGPGASEVAAASVDPILAQNTTTTSPLIPALTVVPPVSNATVSYTPQYTNVTPEEIGAQTVDPLVAENGSTETTLGTPFTLDDTSAVSAVVDWTSLTHEKVLECTRVFLRTPTGATLTLKAIDEAAANPYDVLNIYQNANGGPGQYQIGVQEVASGPCKMTAGLSGATMTVTGPATVGSFTLNTRVTLWDGTSEYLLKNYGQADAQPHDVRTIYDGAGPGAPFELRVTENGAGGEASVSGATLAVTGIECDLGCSTFVAPAPPLADGNTGSPLLVDKGAGPNDLVLTFDNATCSSDHAVVLYGSIGDYSGYQGAVDTGCNAGAGPLANVTHLGNNVWFNVIWVNPDGDAGSAGFATSGTRSWNAAGLCGVSGDDTTDPVCN